LFTPLKHNRILDKLIMTMKKENKENEEIIPSGITRKDAIKKMGKYATLTAMGTFMILNPKKAQAQSASPGGSDDSDDSGNPPAPTGWGD
jgi:hypothetical protein